MEDTTQWMKRRFGRIQLLSADQEIQYGRIIQQWKALERQHETVSEDHEEELDEEQKRQQIKELQKARRNGIKARDKMVTANLRLAFTCVYNKYAHVRNDEDLRDMFQEASLGLTKAAEMFDPEKGYKFSTYSYWWIRHYIQRWLDNKSRLIKLPSGSYSTTKKIEEASINLGADATIEEVAEWAEITVKKANLIKNAPIVGASLDQPLNDDGLTFADTLFYDPPTSWVEELSDDAAQAAGCLDKILGEMIPSHRDLLERNYGLNSEHRESYAEIAKAKKITPSQVRADALKAHRSFRFIARRITLPPVRVEPFNTTGLEQMSLF